MRSHRRTFLYTITAVLALALSACQSAPKATPAPAATSTANAVVQSRIEPGQYTDLAFSVPGRVAEVTAAEGDVVSAGQLLARLAGSEQRQAELARAQQELLAARQARADLNDQAHLANAQAQLAAADARKAVDLAQERLDKLKENSASKDLDVQQAAAQLDLAKAQLLNAEVQAAVLKNGLDPETLQAVNARIDTASAALDAAQAALAALELHAPTAGTLATQHLKVGEFAPAGQAVATLADFSSWVALTDDLTEMEVVRLKVGDAASLVLDALPEQTVAGKVLKISSRYVDKRGDTTYTVTIGLDALPAAARWGMTGQLQFGQGK